MDFLDTSSDIKTDQNKQPYQYNGKELNRMQGSNLYDYPARYMEPALGRFTAMDPLAEKYYSTSPYTYCANNPVRLVDPDGKQGVIPPLPIVTPPPPYIPVTPYSIPPANQRITTGDIRKAVNGISQHFQQTITTMKVFGVMMLLSVSPEFNHQRKREREAKEKLDQQQANVAKSINDNILEKTVDTHPVKSVIPVHFSARFSSALQK